jgi:hypothetical protein
MITMVSMTIFLSELKESLALKNLNIYFAERTTRKILNTLTNLPTRNAPTIGMDETKSIQWYLMKSNLSSALKSPMKKSNKKIAQMTKSA